MPIQEGGRFTPNDKIISPGVFSRENDLSGIAQGVADIGGVVVAPFAKGPGFSPTLITSVVELEQRFGTADGTLYGPYTAKQYLQEKGFVTICRVGALTGYHQQYPWVIWAEYGNYVRTIDDGWVDPTISSVSQTGIANLAATAGTLTSSFSASLGLYSGPSIFWKTNISSSIGAAGTASFRGVAVTMTLKSVSATGNISLPESTSGSLYYAGTTVTGYLNGDVYISASSGLNITASYGVPLINSASILSTLITGTRLSGSLVYVGSVFTSSTVPFDATILKVPVISQSLDACSNSTLNVIGLISGSMGAYTNQFINGTNTYDPCTGLWTTGTSGSHKLLAVLADTQYGGINTSLQAPGFLGSVQSFLTNPTSSVGLDYKLALSQSSYGGYGLYEFSLDANSQKYISNVFGHNAQAGDPSLYAAGTKIEAAYLYTIFEDDITTIVANPTRWKINGTAMPSGSWTGEALKFTDQWSLDLLNGDSSYGLTNAYTPWIVSQKISPWNGGVSTRFPIFKLWTLNDGTYVNTTVKIEVSNVKLAGTVAGSDWGTFTLAVRDYSDTDKKPKTIEQFNNLNLDPTSPNFIARRIGDRYNYIRYDGKIIEFGTYDNLSKHIRVEMSTNPYPITSVPYGFQAYATPVNGAIGHWCSPLAYTKASVYGLLPGKYPSGINFTGIPSGADAELTALYPTASAGQEKYRDSLEYFAPVPSGATIGQNTVFALDEEITASGVGIGSYISASNIVPAIYDATKETVHIKMRKFIFGFQGGFDGQSPAIPFNTGGNITAGNTQGLNCASSTTAGSIAYNQCIGALGNADEFDINLIVTPGIIYSLHSYVTNLVVEMCETRGDCFYILDMYQDDGNPTAGQIDEVVNLASEFDTSYAGTYYPWIKIKDTNINQIVTVPPSVVMPAVYAANDRVAGEWFAAAGLNRGGITQAKQVTDRTTHVERDTLYEGRVNPIAAFPGQGIVAWGQKTLQVKASALDRINVRRLLIEIKKFFASTARFLVFEQNTAATRNKFLAIVNPYLESVQQRNGLYAFQVVMDESNNTPDLVDRNILYGQIWLKPTKSAEFIILDFNVMPTGASFPSA